MAFGQKYIRTYLPEWAVGPDQQVEHTLLDGVPVVGLPVWSLVMGSLHKKYWQECIYRKF